MECVIIRFAQIHEVDEYSFLGTLSKHLRWPHDSAPLLSSQLRIVLSKYVEDTSKKLSHPHRTRPSFIQSNTKECALQIHTSSRREEMNLMHNQSYTYKNISPPTNVSPNQIYSKKVNQVP